MNRKIGHIILAILVFISSTGLLINLHYCREELKGMSFFFEKESCHQPSAGAPACPLHQPTGCGHGGEEEDKKGCCDNQPTYVKTDDARQADLQQLQPWLLVAPVAELVDIKAPAPPTTDAHTRHYLIYRPPIVLTDLPVLFQSFLI